MVKYLLLIIVATIGHLNAFTQSYDNNWVFGDSAGLNFSGGVPTSFNTGITTFESCASISDTFGNLLFYTNGQNIWNKNNEVMPNGDSLNIGLVGYGYPSSITQGVTILPKPGSENLFYLIVMFDINNPFPIPDSSGLSYSLIDMNLDGSFGDVIEKNIPFFIGHYWEKMQAVKHANGRDWWILIHSSPYIDSADCFTRLLITPDAFEGPFYQCFDIIDSIPSDDGYIGQMKFSRDGSKLAFTRGQYFNIYDFDRCTGELSSSVLVNGLITSDFYGCEFSLDKRMLYLTNIDWGVNGSKIFQYCLDCPEPIADTKNIIYKNEFEDYSFSQLQIGPDGKIYAPLGYIYYLDFLHSGVNENISVINSPEAEGLSCDFDTLTISLSPGKNTYTVPNMPNINLGALKGSPCDTLLATVSLNVQISKFYVYPNPATETIRIILTQPEKILSIKTFNYLGEEIEISFDENLYAIVKNIANGFYITEIITEKGKLSLSWEKL